MNLYRLIKITKSERNRRNQFAMKQKRFFTVLVVCCALIFSACEKKEVVEDHGPTKKEWISGTWKQKDITLAASARVSGINLVDGMSLIDDPTLNAVFTSLFGGNPYVGTKANTYTFSSNGTYSMEGMFLEYVFPESMGGGRWDLDVYNTVVALFPTEGERDPHWITKVSPTELHLVLSVTFPGLGAVPLNLILEK